MSRRTAKVQNELLVRYKLLRAIRICYYNLLNADFADVAREFFFVTGDIMEGKPIEYDQLRYLKKEAVDQYLKEER